MRCAFRGLAELVSSACRPDDSRILSGGQLAPLDAGEDFASVRRVCESGVSGAVAWFELYCAGLVGGTAGGGLAGAGADGVGVAVGGDVWGTQRAGDHRGADWRGGGRPVSAQPGVAGRGADQGVRDRADGGGGVARVLEPVADLRVDCDRGRCEFLRDASHARADYRHRAAARADECDLGALGWRARGGGAGGAGERGDGGTGGDSDGAAGGDGAVVVGGVIVLLVPTVPRTVRGVQEPLSRIFRDAFAGLRSMVGMPTVSTLLGMAIVVEIFGFAYQAVMPAMARDELHVAESGLGTLRFATGIGAVAGVAALSFLGDFRRKGRCCWRLRWDMAWVCSAWR